MLSTLLHDPLFAIVTWSELILLAIVMGIVASNLWVLPRGNCVDLRNILPTLRNRLWLYLGYCLVALIILNMAELISRTWSMSELPFSESFSEIGTVLFKTHVGKYWLLRTIALIALCIAWYLGRRIPKSSIVQTLAFIAMMGIAFTLSTSGHGGDSGTLSLANIANSLHMIGGFLWGGSTIVTSFFIFPPLLRAYAPGRELVAMVSLRLSRLAGLALALTLIPGLYNAWQQIGNWHALWTKPYGQILLTKIIIVTGMIVLGAANRYIFIPAIQYRSARTSWDKSLSPVRLLRGFILAVPVKRPFRSLRDSLRIETILLLGILFSAVALSEQSQTADEFDYPDQDQSDELTLSQISHKTWIMARNCPADEGVEPLKTIARFNLPDDLFLYQDLRWCDACQIVARRD